MENSCRCGKEVNGRAWGYPRSSSSPSEDEAAFLRFFGLRTDWEIGKWAAQERGRGAKSRGRPGHARHTAPPHQSREQTPTHSITPIPKCPERRKI